MSRRNGLTPDSTDDPQLIAEYKRLHERIWPQFTASLKDSGAARSTRRNPVGFERLRFMGDL